MGFFLSKRLPFLAVKRALAEQWKLNSLLNTFLLNNRGFVFKSSEEEDKEKVIEKGFSL